MEIKTKSAIMILYCSPEYKHTKLRKSLFAKISDHWAWANFNPRVIIWTYTKHCYTTNIKAQDHLVPDKKILTFL